MKIRVSAELAIPAHTYLLERDGAAFRSFIAEEMNLMSYDIDDCWREGGATFIRIASKPDVGAWIPGSLSSKIPDKLEYCDIVEYRPERLQQPPYQLSVHSEVPFLKDKGRFSSITIIEPLGPDRCRHTLEQHIEFKGLWGLGAVAKKLAKKSLEQTFDDMPAVIDKWMRLREELLQSPQGRERLLAGRPRVEGVEWMDEQVAAIKQLGTPRVHRKSKRPKPAKSPLIGTAAGASPAASPGPARGASIPLHSPFAAVSGGQPASAAAGPQAQAGQPAVGAGQQQGQQAVAAPPAAPAAAGVVGAPGEGEFWDAQEARPGRQSTSGTAFFTPNASLMPSASGEVSGLPRSQASGPINGMPGPARAGGMASAGRAGSGPAEGAAPAGQEGLAPGVSWLSTAAVGGGAGSGSIPESSSGGSPSREGSKHSSSESEDWEKGETWRAFYAQRGMTATRPSHMLPEELVVRFINGRKPVQVEKLGGGPSRRRSRLGRLFGACGGKHGSAEE